MYYNEFFERKSIVDELEGSLDGAKIDAINPEVLAVDVEANSHEDITVISKVSKINKYSNEI